MLISRSAKSAGFGHIRARRRGVIGSSGVDDSAPCARHVRFRRTLVPELLPYPSAPHPRGSVTKQPARPSVRDEQQIPQPGKASVSGSMSSSQRRSPQRPCFLLIPSLKTGEKNNSLFTDVQLRRVGILLSHLEETINHLSIIRAFHISSVPSLLYFVGCVSASLSEIINLEQES